MNDSKEERNFHLLMMNIFFYIWPISNIIISFKNTYLNLSELVFFYWKSILIGNWIGLLIEFNESNAFWAMIEAKFERPVIEISYNVILKQLLPLGQSFTNEQLIWSSETGVI